MGYYCYIISLWKCNQPYYDEIPIMLIYQQRKLLQCINTVPSPITKYYMILYYQYLLFYLSIYQLPIINYYYGHAIPLQAILSSMPLECLQFIKIRNIELNAKIRWL